MIISVPLPGEDDRRIPARIRRVPTGADWSVVITSHRAAKCWTHFLDGRTVVCRSPTYDCRGCEIGVARRWEAYLSARPALAADSFVLMLPKLAWAEVERCLGEKAEAGLRGQRFRLRRPGTDPRGRVEVEALGEVPAGQRIGQGLDVPTILARAWGVPRELLD